jgi:hypothetical protein
MMGWLSRSDPKCIAAPLQGDNHHANYEHFDEHRRNVSFYRVVGLLVEWVTVVGTDTPAVNLLIRPEGMSI